MSKIEIYREVLDIFIDDPSSVLVCFLNDTRYQAQQTFFFKLIQFCLAQAHCPLLGNWKIQKVPYFIGLKPDVIKLLTTLLIFNHFLFCWLQIRLEKGCFSVLQRWSSKLVRDEQLLGFHDNLSQSSKRRKYPNWWNQIGFNRQVISKRHQKDARSTEIFVQRIWW